MKKSRVLLLLPLTILFFTMGARTASAQELPHKAKALLDAEYPG